MQRKYAYGLYAWKDFDSEVREIIIKNNFTNIAEIGGGANPLLSIDFIESQKLKYHVIDISERELSKASTFYEKKVADLENPAIIAEQQYDFIFAQMTLEHIKDPKIFYSNIYKFLKPGGTAFFFFACLTSLPSIVNFVMPEYMSSKILLLLQPFRKNENHGKFKAYYKWCFGPTRRNILRFQQLNFKVLSYTGYLGHSYYQKISILNYLEKIKTKFLLKYPSPCFCTYAHVLLKKNTDAMC